MSQSPNNALGKGLDSLIPNQVDDIHSLSSPAADAPAGMPIESVVNIALDSIDANPYQPRNDFEQTQLQELAESIKQHGVIQPIIVAKENDWRYKLIAGERRLRASKLAGLSELPAIVRSFSKQQQLEVALIENVQRENLKPLELAAAYQKLDIEFNLTHKKIGEAVGKAQSTITNVIRLLNLSSKAKQALNNGVITEGHARSLLSLEDESRQNKFLDYIIKHNLTVRHAENLVREFKKGVEIAKRKVNSAEAPQRALTSNLGKYLGTKVSIQKTAKGGKLLIEYYSDEELARIYTEITGKQAAL